MFETGTFSVSGCYVRYIFLYKVVASRQEMGPFYWRAEGKMDGGWREEGGGVENGSKDKQGI